MLALSATGVWPGGQPYFSRLRSIPAVAHFVSEVTFLERPERHFRIVWAIFDQQDFGFVYSIHLFSLLFWQREKKRGALIKFCFRPNASPMPVNDALDQGQPHSRPFKF